MSEELKKLEEKKSQEDKEREQAEESEKVSDEGDAIGEKTEKTPEEDGKEAGKDTKEIIEELNIDNAKMKKIAILGAGLIGAPMTFDLASTGEFDVTVVDVDTANLEKFKDHEHIKTIVQDLLQPENVSAVVEDVDLVLSAVPGFMGFQTLKAVI